METLKTIQSKGRKPRTKKEVVDSTLTIIDKQNRKILNEGRSYQLGFAFLKKINDFTFETVQPISPCKDYLNDVVYSEVTGKECVAHGLRYNKLGIFDNKEAYIAIKVCPNWSGSEYPSQKDDEKNLNENFKKIEEFVNFFEDKIGTETKTIIEKVSDNLFLLRVPLYWCKYTYLISLYSLFVRCAQWYKDGDPLNYFSHFSKLGDNYNVVNAKPKVDKILAGNLSKQDLKSLSGNKSVHNLGIVSYQF